MSSTGDEFIPSDDASQIVQGQGAQDINLAYSISPDVQSENDDFGGVLLKSSDAGRVAVEADDSEDSYNGDDFEDGAEHGERNGRFYGPESSWRRYTHDIRALATSLDSIENNDLAIHLYNVHALKARLRPQEPLHRTTLHREKRSWIPKAQREASLSYLPSIWTGWPLTPIDVPRQREVWGVPTEYPHEQPDVYYKIENWTPSVHLEDELVATTLRLANVEAKQQHWPRVEPTEYHTSSASHPEPEVRSTVGVSTEVEASTLAPSPSPPLRQIPTFSADDEASSHLIKSPIRHIIAQLDDLLNALHRGRAGHRIAAPKPNSKNNKKRPRPSSRARSQTRGLVSSSARKPTPKRQKSKQASVADPTPQPPVPMRKKYKGRQTLGPRDWSEILTTALQVGWDSEVVKRTAKRCAGIFGEGMEITTMPEVANGRGERGERFGSSASATAEDERGLTGENAVGGEEAEQRQRHKGGSSGLHGDGFLGVVAYKIGTGRGKEIG